MIEETSLRSMFMIARLAAFVALASTTPADAHHSGAAFDRSKTVEVHGTVDKIEWTSPHARLYVIAKDENGTASTWDFELPSPVTLTRRGWPKTALAIGDAVTVTGAPARDHPNIAIATGVIDATGKRLFSGSASSTE
jgi:uncharacterized protein DUF6152